MNSEFYVGYLDKAPPGISKHIKKVILVLVITVLLLAWLLASQQKGFAGSTYQYAQETVLTGMLDDYPVPSLILHQGQLNGQPILQYVPLVEFGKVGGQGLIENWSEHVGTWVTIKGHLIYYEGKSLMEITDVQALEKADPPRDVPGTLTMEDIRYNQTTFVGEIVDAKCYFGVMKPGHGKPHRSCAIRCISGGIPAVLKVRDRLDRVDYHLISMEQGTPGELAARIGESVEVQGSLVQRGDWYILTIRGSDAVKPLSWSIPDFSKDLVICRN